MKHMKPPKWIQMVVFLDNYLGWKANNHLKQTKEDGSTNGVLVSWVGGLDCKDPLMKDTALL